MRSRFSLFDNTNAYQSMGSHLCTKKFFLGTFLFTNTMRLHFCISDGVRQVIHGVGLELAIDRPPPQGEFCTL